MGGDVEVMATEGQAVVNHGHGEPAVEHYQASSSHVLCLYQRVLGRKIEHYQASSPHVLRLYQRVLGGEK